MLYIFIILILIALLFIWSSLKVSSLCSLEEEEIAKKEEK